MESIGQPEQISVPKDEVREDEAAVFEESQRLGRFLSMVLVEMSKGPRSQSSRGGFGPLARRSSFIFRPHLDRGSVVFVDATAFNFDPRGEDTRLATPVRNFHISLRRLEPSTDVYDWSVEELTEGGTTKYEPTFVGRDAVRKEANKSFGISPPPDFDRRKAPSPERIKEAVQVIEEAWRLYKVGNRDVLEFWHHPDPEAE